MELVALMTTTGMAHMLLVQYWAMGATPPKERTTAEWPLGPTFSCKQLVMATMTAHLPFRISKTRMLRLMRLEQGCTPTPGGRGLMHARRRNSTLLTLTHPHAGLTTQRIRWSWMQQRIITRILLSYLRWAMTAEIAPTPRSDGRLLIVPVGKMVRLT